MSTTHGEKPPKSSQKNLTEKKTASRPTGHQQTGLVSIDFASPLCQRKNGHLFGANPHCTTHFKGIIFGSTYFRPFLSSKIDSEKSSFARVQNSYCYTTHPLPPLPGQQYGVLVIIIWMRLEKTQNNECTKKPLIYKQHHDIMPEHRMKKKRHENHQKN